MCNTRISSIMLRAAGIPENTKHSQKYQKITQASWKKGSGSFVCEMIRYTDVPWLSFLPRSQMAAVAVVVCASEILIPTAPAYSSNSSLGKSSHCCSDRCDRRLFRVLITDIVVVICFVWSPLILSFSLWRDISQDGRISYFSSFIRLRIPGDNTITWLTI